MRLVWGQQARGFLANRSSPEADWLELLPRDLPCLPGAATSFVVELTWAWRLRPETDEHSNQGGMMNLATLLFLSLTLQTAPSFRSSTPQVVQFETIIPGTLEDERLGRHLSMNSRFLIASSDPHSVRAFEAASVQWTAAGQQHLSSSVTALALNNNDRAAISPYASSSFPAVLLFTLTGESWIPGEDLPLSGDSSNGAQASSIAAEGDVIVAGVRSSQVDGTGVVYVFEEGPQNWAETAKLLAPTISGIRKAAFGSSVALRADNPKQAGSA